MNTDLLKWKHEYLYKKMMAWLKLNEIISVIKKGEILLRFGTSFCKKGGRGSLCSETFYNGYENLIKCQYIYIYIYMQTDIYVCVYVRVCMQTYVCLYVYIFMCMCTHIYCMIACENITWGW